MQQTVRKGIALWRMLPYEENGMHNRSVIRELEASLKKVRTTLLPRERQAYTDAVNCLMSKPSRIATTDPSIAPGAKSRLAGPLLDS
jgi:hypothetical protein